jgi:hypothetical protein
VKINFLFQKILLLIIGLSINFMAFIIIDFIVQNGFAALFNFATIYPFLGVPTFLIAVIALCSVVAGLLSNE